MKSVVQFRAWLVVICACLPLSPALAYDAEDGTTLGWDIYDVTPAGASIANVFDPVRNSQVIETTGTEQENGFRLTDPDYAAWTNGSRFVIEWSMRFDEPYTVYINVDTSVGQRYVTYRPVDGDTLGSGQYARFGLGSGTDDGHWVMIARDLQADLSLAQPGAEIYAVTAFLIRGSGKLDDIRMVSELLPDTEYENAEDGLTTGWHIYDATPAGASITSVYDVARAGRVIETVSTDRQNGFRLGNADLSPWGNSAQFVIEWSMRFDASYTLFVDVQTTDGRRYLEYEPLDIDRLGSGSTVRHGLGTASTNGQWITVVRDLRADLAAAQPNLVIQSVDAFLVRGSGRVDDVRLRTQMPVVDVIYEDAEDATINGWDIYDATPSGATISNVYDSSRASRSIETSGFGGENGFRLRSENFTPWANSSKTVIGWSMRFDVPYTVYIDVQTTAGQRFMTYRPVDNDALGGGQYVNHGLGTDTDDGNWVTVKRDLQADLSAAQPGVDILRVNAFLVRGSGRVDDIALLGVPEVSNLAADFDAASGAVLLTWSAPGGTFAEGFDVRRRTDGVFPQGPGDGTLVVSAGAGQEFALDTFVPGGSLGETAYYTVFARGAPGVYSAGARIGLYCDASECVTVPDLDRLTDVAAVADVDARRARLIDEIWGGSGFPAHLPVSVTAIDPTEPPLYRPPNAVLTEQIMVDRGDIFFIADFKMRLYTPASPNGKLVIFHSGHRGLTDARMPVLERFLQEGYNVLEVSMPMAGYNFHSFYHAPFGLYHEDIAWLDNPMRFFFEQLAVGLNYLTTARGFADIYMVGISGGGWTTTVYAAIDPRVTANYPVAGSYPAYLREQLGVLADFEQVHPGFYQHANYLDLYLLSAAGRRQLMIYNVFDDCCWHGTFGNTFVPFLQSRLGNLGGTADVVFDDTFVGHSISSFALETIVTDMAAQ